ncbi:holo-ACP synthase [Candidatus Woesearchaeota archaeon]|nr:holo-ACP synthase [Candidatus Woesearchaeota archaeon]
MIIKIGCDIVKIKRFSNLSITSLNRIFHKSELKNTKPESLAGIFTAKESCKKIFNNLKWHDIEIKKQKNGKPVLLLNLNKNNQNIQNILSHDISISHDGGYAIAIVIFLLENKK